MSTPTKRQREAIRRTLEHAVVAVRDIPNAALTEFIPHLEEAKRQLENNLKAWVMKQDGANRYTAHKMRSALYQIEGAIESIRQLEPSLAATLIKADGKAAAAAMNAMESQLASLDELFRGATVPISFDRAEVLARGEKLLLRRYPSSAARYAGAIEGEVRRKMAVGVLKQNSIGQTTNELFKEIPGVFKSAKFNAHRLVRTETMNSYNTYHHESLIEAHEEDDDIRMRWDASYDFRRCAECADLDGRVVDVDGKFKAKWTTPSGASKRSINQRPPAHPQCFVAETEVSGEFVAGLKAFYSGPVAEITIKSGRRLTVTPNHPILSSLGWVAAGDVSEGDDLICHGAYVDRPVTSLGVDIGDPPSEIEKVFELLRSAGTPSLAAAAAGDLHGDAAGVNGNVEIVSLNGPLERGAESDLIGDLGGVKADSDLLLVSGYGKAAQRLGAPDRAADCVVCGAHLPISLTFRHERPFHSLSIGLSSELNASIRKPSGNDSAIDSEFLRQLIDRGSGEVFADKVIKVRKLDFSGHVYDLQSVSGWLVADGIVSSNCRCVLVPWIDEWPNEGWPDKAPEEGPSVPAIATKNEGRHE